VTTSQKAALSLLISVLLFGAFTALAFTGLFNLIETRFYNPSVTASMTGELTRNAQAVDQYFGEIQARFSGTLKEPAIRRSFLPNQSAGDIFDRSRIYGLMGESLGGFQWVRFIDSGGSRLHFSTNSADILNQDRQSISYRNYSEPNAPYAAIAVPDGAAPKYILDETGDRILFSFPFYDSYDVYRGTALFSISVQAVSDMLIREGRIKVGQDISVVSDPQGFLYGISAVNEKALIPRVSSIWKEGGVKIAGLASPDSGVSLALISAKTAHGLFVGQLLNEEIFSFPLTMKIILLASFFLTVYLTIFLLFNLRQDSVTIVQNRLKQLQISLIEQYYDRKGEMDWNRWSRELEQRRGEVSTQIKRGIKTAPGRKSGEIDILIDKSWDELLSVMGGRKDTSLDEEKLQILLNRILAAISSAPAQLLPPQPSGTPVPVLPAAAAAAAMAAAATAPAGGTSPSPQARAPVPVSVEPVKDGEAEEAELLEELEGAEDLEPGGEAKKAEQAEPAEELEELEELEEVTELPEDTPAAAAGTSKAGASRQGPSTVSDTVEELEELEAAESDDSPAPAPQRASPPAGEVPVIDVAAMNLSAAAADEVMKAPASVEEIEVLEEIEELDAAEEAQAPAAKGSSQSPGAHPAAPENDLAKLASQIEFSYDPEPDISGDEPISGDLEIVSPFSTMLSDFSSFSEEDIVFTVEEGGIQSKPRHSPEHPEAPVPPGTAPVPGSGDHELAKAANISVADLLPADEDEKKNIPLDESQGEVLLEEENLNRGFSLALKPFFNSDGKIESLNVLPAENNNGASSDEDGEPLQALEVIEEREGVHYINADALAPDPKAAANLNRNFKKLVDSIIK